MCREGLSLLALLVQKYKYWRSYCARRGLGFRGTQFTCFTCTKVQILAYAEALVREQACGSSAAALRALLVQRICFTSTKVQILAHAEALGREQACCSSAAALLALLVQHICFTSTKVQIMTHLLYIFYTHRGAGARESRL